MGIVLEGVNQSNQLVTPQFNIYPRNASNFEFYEDIWMSVDKNVIQFSVGNNLVSFDNFINSEYGTYKVIQIVIGTEELSGFEG